MFSLLLPMLICVFPGLAYQGQGLLGNVAMVPAVDVGGGWGLCIYQEEWCFCSCQIWSYPVTGEYLVKYLSQFVGSSHKFLQCGFWVFVEDFKLAITLWMYGAEKILSIPSCCKTWSIRLLLNPFCYLIRFTMGTCVMVNIQ